MPAPERVYVPSRNRPHHVPRMLDLAGGIELVWLVSEEQADAYRAYGAKRVIVCEPGKEAKHNLVLDRFGDRWCVFSDDDCRGLRMLTNGRRHRTTLSRAAAEFVRVGEARRDRLVSMPAFTNMRFMSETVSDWGAASGWFFAVAPGTPERFDASVPIFSDSDYAARIFLRYGRIARVNHVRGEYDWGGSASNYDYARRVDGWRVVARRYPELFSGYTTETLMARRLGEVNPIPACV